MYVFAYLERAGKLFLGGGVLPADLIFLWLCVCVRVCSRTLAPLGAHRQTAAPLCSAHKRQKSYGLVVLRVARLSPRGPGIATLLPGPWLAGRLLDGGRAGQL